MGQIRRQTILSSMSTYVGFLVGALSTYLFVHAGAGGFTPAQYGLTRAFLDVGTLMYAFGSLGVSFVLYKFIPYYTDHLARKDNDLLAWTLLLTTVGFGLVVLGGWIFEPLIVRKYSAQSYLFVAYYRWVFPFGLGYLFFFVLEAYAVALKQSVFSTFLREGAVRICVLVLIFVYLVHWITFDVFIKLFAFQYILTTVFLWIYLSKKDLTQLTFTVSKVTRRLKKKMLTMISVVYGGMVIQIGAQAFDGLLIMGFVGLSDAGIYAFLVYVVNTIQVPQRSVQYVAIPHLSKAWKDKDLTTINRIYHRTSINLLIVSACLFCLIVLNYNDAIPVLHVKSEYQPWLSVVFILGIARVVDNANGVNSHVIGTSTFWRFEFFSNMLFLAIRIALDIILIKHYGIMGAAVADLVSMVAYNATRWIFLSAKFKMQPFTYKSLLAVFYAGGAYLLVLWSCASLSGWVAIFARTALFTGLFGGATLLSKLTPDTAQVWAGIREKIRAIAASFPRP